MDTRSISIVIPAYNEEKVIKRSIKKIVKYCSSHFEDYEIIVVDDGSVDNTRQLVSKLISKNPRIKINKKRSNRGKGYSVKEGVLMASKELVLFTDADLSTPIEELDKFLPHISSYDIIIAERTKKELLLKRQPFYRELSGMVFNLILRILFKIPFKDTQCGFKLFKKEAALRLFKNLQTPGFAFDVEVIMRAIMLNYKILSIPVIWENDEQSKVKLFKDSFKMFFEIMKLKKIKKNEPPRLKSGYLLGTNNVPRQRKM